MMKFTYQTLNPNDKGRDFVMGDLHGCYSALMFGLKELKFNPELDRLVSVGDLVDRGPDSMKCLSLLTEPWFHCVLGNHEQMMLDHLFYDDRMFLYNGGDWLLKENKETLKAFALKYIVDLPCMIRVPVGNEFVNVIHAEFAPRPGEVLTDTYILDNFSLQCAREAYDGPTIIWGRRLFLDWFAKDLTDRNLIKWKRNPANDWEDYLKLINNENLSVTYCGHTSVHDVTRFGKMVNLDTGSYRQTEKKWAGVAIHQLGTNNYWKMRSDSCKHSVVFNIA